MNPLKQFDSHFGLHFTQEQIEKMFVHNIENALFEKIGQDKYHGIFYRSFMKDLCLTIGIDKESVITKQWHNFFPLKDITKGDYTHTLRILVAIHYTLEKNSPELAITLAGDIQKILAELPASLNIRWYAGNFYRDEIPEMSEQLIDQTLEWLIPYPAARMDMQHALSNYSAGNNTGILENVYKALENIIQRITGVTAGLHTDSIMAAVKTDLNLPAYWVSQLNRFIVYANEMARHGRNEKRYEAEKEEVEAFLFIAIILMRLVISKQHTLMAQPIAAETLLRYIKTSTIIKRIEETVATSLPQCKLIDALEVWNPAARPWLNELKELKLTHIQDLDKLLHKHERKLIVLQQEEVKDYPENSVIGRGQSIHWLVTQIQLGNLT